MSNPTFNLSIENAHATVESINRFQKQRKGILKKSDVRELVTHLLGLESSNVLDSLVKQARQKQEANSVFHVNGKHKKIEGLLLKRYTNPMQIIDRFRSNPDLKIAIRFWEKFQVQGGYEFKENDWLFAQDLDTAYKMILNWDEIVKFEFRFWKDEEHEELKTRSGGYWFAEFVGDGDEQFLGEDGSNYLCSSEDDAELNYPECTLESVSQNFLEKVIRLRLEQTTTITYDEDDYFKEELIDWFYESYQAQSLSAFKKFILRFQQYLDINELLALSIDVAPTEYVEHLEKMGATSHRETSLLIDAMKTGNTQTCKYLISKGNSLAKLLVPKVEIIEATAFHLIAHIDYESPEYDSLVSNFYSCASELGISINTRDKLGRTPLHHCSIYGSKMNYGKLIALGADPDLVDSQGKKPSELLDERIEKEKQLEEKQRKEMDVFWSSVGFA